MEMPESLHKRSQPRSGFWTTYRIEADYSYNTAFAATFSNEQKTLRVALLAHKSLATTARYTHRERRFDLKVMT